MIDLQNLYLRAGFITGQFLDPVVITGMQHDSDRLHQEAAGMISSEGDFNLEAQEGGYHDQHAGSPSTLTGVLRKVSNVVDHSAAAASISERDDF
jgi:hypothetical protein